MTATIPSVISCQELKDLLQSSSQSIAVLEADLGKQVEADFKAGHIPKARYFDQLEHTTPTAFIPRGLPDVKSFEDYLTRLGVSNDHHIILYDRSANGFFAASRAWFLLKTYGADKVSILNGGFNAWKKEDNEIEKSDESNDSAKEGQTNNFTVKLNEQMVRNFDQMVSNISLDKDNPERIQVFDARPPNLFYGADAGHMPNAVNLPYRSLFDQNQHLKSKEQLTQIFDKAGVDLSKPTIYTCQGGVTASTLAFVAQLLGQQEPSVYMGAFTEWQQRAPADLIIKGDGTPTAQ
ncbi:unnamed protein product [Adineta ricciae]|uniref:Rhodanese domain-containing protein n=2 Tax=Adineta ricciae TaxID=249248 RepID=A0A815TPT8_ADIRI|nr:unnamed protein product [Adineta ricciae]